MKHHLTILIQNATLIHKMVMEGILIHFNWKKKKKPDLLNTVIKGLGSLEN